MRDTLSPSLKSNHRKRTSAERMLVGEWDNPHLHDLGRLMISLGEMQERREFLISGNLCLSCRLIDTLDALVKDFSYIQVSSAFWTK